MTEAHLVCATPPREGRWGPAAFLVGFTCVLYNLARHQEWDKAYAWELGLGFRGVFR